ncbi:MAG: hypothetical protein LWW85_14855, partial [Marinilabiliales bacterium]|nr:hypothetical protein [Marinilabiliales bacterium]
FIKIELYPENEVVYDPDFDSVVLTRITNSGPMDLEVTYKTPFGKEVRLVPSQSKVMVKNTIKGVSKDKLSATILSIGMGH